MSNPIFESYEISSLQQDIMERRDVIDRFHQTGQLDRNDTISKIKKLRMTDKEILQVTAVNLAVSSTPFEQCSNEQLINELHMQKTILEGKLTEKLKGI